MYYRIVSNRVKTGRIYGSSSYNFTYSEYDSAKAVKFYLCFKIFKYGRSNADLLNKNQGVGIYEFDPSVHNVPKLELNIL